MLKKILAFLAVVLVIIGVGGYFLGANLDSLIRMAVEKYGSAATQTSVKLEGVKLAPTSGEGALSGLSVGNPSGFESENAFYLGRISVKVDPKSLAGAGAIVIREIRIEKPQITYEINNEGSNNLQTLAHNAQSYANSLTGGSKKTEAKKEESPEEKSQSRKIIVETLVISDGQISISQEMLKGKKLSANLPTIRLTNIGKSEGGATPAEIAEKVIAAITSSASQVASDSLAKELGSSIEKATQGVLNGGSTEEVGDQIKGLFGK